MCFAPEQIKDLGIAVDKKEEIEAQFDAALEWGADILLTSGGVSMGDRDYVKPLLEKVSIRTLNTSSYISLRRFRRRFRGCFLILKFDAEWSINPKPNGACVQSSQKQPPGQHVMP